MNGADLAVLVVPFLDGSSNRVEAGTDLEDKQSIFSLFAYLESQLEMVYTPRSYWLEDYSPFPAISTHIVTLTRAISVTSRAQLLTTDLVWGGCFEHVRTSIIKKRSRYQSVAVRNYATDRWRAERS